MVTIGSGVFGKCSSLSNISFPSNLSTIGNCTFYGCNGLTSIMVPNTVKTIEVEAFKSCSNLSSVTISGANTSLHYGCFSNCSPKLVIYGERGSSAETYANDNSILFQSLDESQQKSVNNNVYYINSVDSNQIILDALSYDYDESNVSFEALKPYVGKYAYIEFDSSISPKVIGIKGVNSDIGTITSYVETNSSGEVDSIEIDHNKYQVGNKHISVIDGRNSRVLYHTIDDQIVGIEFLKTSGGYYNGKTANSITVSNKEYHLNSASRISDKLEKGKPIIFSVGTKNNDETVCPFLLEAQELQGTPSVWVYVSDHTFSTEIGQELDLYCALHIGDYVIPNWDKPSFAVGNDKLVTLSNYEQTDLGYHCKIKGVAVGETSLTITDTETGAHQSFPIRVKAKSESQPYSCRINEVPDYTIESGWDKGLQTNIYNVNGLYVNKYKYEKNDESGYDVSFNVYNSLYMYGSVDVYDKDGNWIQSEKIDKLKGITGIYETIDSLLYLIDDAAQQKSLTYEATTFSQKTEIKITVPKDGYFVISTDYADSPGVMLYNGMDIIMLGLDAAVDASEKIDFNCNLEKYLSDAKEKKLHEVLQEAIDSNSKKFLSDALKEGMTTGIGNAANAIVLQANEILSPENMDEDIYKDIFGVGNEVIENYMGPAGAALKLLFGIQKYADYTCQVMQICKGVSKSEIVISATSTPSVHGITVKPDNPATVGESVLQVFRVSDQADIASSFENAIDTQSNQYEIYNICFVKDNEEQEINTDVTVRIPIPKNFDKNKSAIYRQEKDGSWTKLNSRLDGNYLVFETNHFSFYAIAESPAVDEPETTLISSITLNMKNATVAKNGTIRLNAAITPSNATNPELHWSSNTPSVATVDQTGLVTAVSVGKATITARAQDGSGVEALCIVEVTGDSSNNGDNTSGNNTTPIGPEKYDNMIHNYIPEAFGTCRTSFIGTLPDEEYQTVVYDDNVLYVNDFDKDGHVVMSKEIPLELPVWGGVFLGESYNYVVCGQVYDSSQEDGGEVYRIIQYDKNFDRINSLSLTGNETYTGNPFDAGNVSIDENGNEITVYTSRLRLDGHQSNIAIRINTENMSIKNTYGMGAFPDVHVSHSFRQIFQYDEGEPVYVDLSDGYPARSVYIQSDTPLWST